MRKGILMKEFWFSGEGEAGANWDCSDTSYRNPLHCRIWHGLGSSSLMVIGRF